MGKKGAEGKRKRAESRATQKGAELDDGDDWQAWCMSYAKQEEAVEQPAAKSPKQSAN